MSYSPFNVVSGRDLAFPVVFVSQVLEQRGNHVNPDHTLSLINGTLLTWHSDEGTKVVLEERLQEHFDNHPELEENATFAKFVAFRRKQSPVKVTQIDEIAAVVEDDDKPASSPGRLFSLGQRFKASFSSPLKSNTTAADTEDESDDEDEQGSDVELLSTEKDRELVEDDADQTPFFESVKEWVEEQQDKVLDWYYDGQDLLIEKSDATKKFLSSASTINFLTTGVESAVLIKQQVPLTTLKQLSFLDQKILAKYSKYIDLNATVPDLAVFGDLKFLLVLLTWATLSIFLPVLGSYYFNFIGKKQKKVKFDPFVFNLVKLLLAYIFLSGTVSFDDIKNNAEVWADENGILASATLYQKLKAHSFHNTLTLKLVLGNLPFVGSVVGLLVALYIAAI